jgi:hypothetical protein
MVVTSDTMFSNESAALGRGLPGMQRRRWAPIAISQTRERRECSGLPSRPRSSRLPTRLSNEAARVYHATRRHGQAARAQQQTMPVIGFLDPRSPDAVADLQRAARRPALAAVHDHKRPGGGIREIEGVPPGGRPSAA